MTATALHVLLALALGGAARWAAQETRHAGYLAGALLLAAATCALPAWRKLRGEPSLRVTGRLLWLPYALLALLVLLGGCPVWCALGLLPLPLTARAWERYRAAIHAPPWAALHQEAMRVSLLLMTVGYLIHGLIR